MGIKNKIYILSITLLFVSNFGCLYFANTYKESNPGIAGFYVLLAVMFIQIAFNIGLFRTIECNNTQMKEKLEFNHLLIKDEIDRLKK